MGCHEITRGAPVKPLISDRCDSKGSESEGHQRTSERSGERNSAPVAHVLNGEVRRVIDSK